MSPILVNCWIKPSYSASLALPASQARILLIWIDDIGTSVGLALRTATMAITKWVPLLMHSRLIFVILLQERMWWSCKVMEGLQLSDLFCWL